METIEQTTYAVMLDKIRGRVAFTGNSAKGVSYSENDYAVVSYDTVIGRYENGVAWVSNEFYSKTTSRLQNLCRQAWGV
jgi:hypothetical protein